MSSAQIVKNELVRFTREQGMPSNEGYCVFKDSRGFIWVATDEGVVRMKSGSKDVIDTLPDNTIFKIREDKKGRIWFFSYTHKWSYFENEQLYEYRFNEKLTKALQSAVLLDVWIKDDETFILNTSHQKNFKVNITTGEVSSSNYFTEGVFLQTWKMNVYEDANGFVFAQHQQTGGSKLSGFSINVISENRTQQYQYNFPLRGRYQFYGTIAVKGNIFVYADNMLLKLNKDGTVFCNTFQHEILSIFYDSIQSNIIVGFRAGGVSKISLEDGRILEQYEMLLNKSISSIAIDNDGGEWYATLEDGVFYNKQPALKKISNHKTFRLCNFNQNNLLYADVNGLHYYKNNTSTQLGNEKASFVYDIDAINDQQILMSGTYTFSYLNSKILEKNSAIQMNGNPVQIKYIASTSGIAFQEGASYYSRVSLDLLKFALQPNGEYVAQQIIVKGNPERGPIFLDSKHKLWMLGRNNLYQFDTSSQQFTPHTYNSNLFLNGVSFMTEINSTLKIFALRSNGLAIFNESTLLAHLKEADGLPTDNIRYLSVRNGKLWAVSSKGVSVIDINSLQPFSYTIYNLGENIGLNNKIIYQVLPIDSTLYLACSEGLFELKDVYRFTNIKTSPIPFYITKLSLDDMDTNAVNSINIPYSNKRIAIHFEAINYNATNSIRYFYRIANKGEAWYEISSTQLELQNLSAGLYDIELKASIPDQERYSLVQKISLNILKPWWQTNLFYVLMLTSVLGLLYFILKKRIAAIKKNNNEKTRIKLEMMNLEQTALRSQMNPHFIFNSLSSIQELVVSGNKDEANDYLVKFARLIRKTLELSQQPFISLADEKEYIIEYVAMEKMRMDKAFDFTFEIDTSLDVHKTEIPNMMLQPIVENSIRHGIKQLNNRKGALSVKIKKEDNFLHCSITDNGVGIQPHKSNNNEYSSHKSFGLDIVEKRLMGLPNYKVGNYFIKVENLLDEKHQRMGTLVEIHLPLMYTHHD